MERRIYRKESQYRCPICRFHGVFLDYNPESGMRKHAMCPKCHSMERHRLQYLAVLEIKKKRNLKDMDMLHFAPEECLRQMFQGMFRTYITADLHSIGVDRTEDMTRLSFSRNSFDVLFASYVLQYIKNDSLALSEVRRVLRPNGIAILPVPVIGRKTVEYPEPNPHEENHVRCPGVDYYKRYKQFFSKVDIYSSRNFQKEYQTYVYQDRMNFSRKNMPLRPIMRGKKHLSYVPLCYK